MIQVEQLLAPRRKVIADWPFNNLFKVGDILIFFKSMDGENKEYWYHHEATHQNFQDSWFDKFPHLFKELFWWEERSIEDLPKYVKYHNGNIQLLTKDMIEFGMVVMEDYQPATLQEYQSYKQHLQQSIK